MAKLEYIPASAQVDAELFDFLMNCSSWGGDFLSSLAQAALRADAENYPIIRPALLSMKRRYPDFDVPHNPVQRPCIRQS
jgi:hypothetical protein